MVCLSLDMAALDINTNLAGVGFGLKVELKIEHASPAYE